MAINLTNSYRDRQKILNNSYLLQKIEQHFNLNSIFYNRICFENNFVFTKQELKRLFDVSRIVIDECIANCEKELKASGYILLKEEKLKKFLSSCDSETIEYNTKGFEVKECDTQIEVLELFTFKAWLNIAMLLSESEKAKFVRSRILDIVIDIVAEREGNRVRYIDRSLQHEHSEQGRQAIIVPRYLANAAKKYLNLDDIKQNPLHAINKFDRYAYFYKGVYELVFRDKYLSCKNNLANNTSSSMLERNRLEKESYFCSLFSGYRLRTGLYYEILQAIVSIEQELAEKMQLLSEQKDRKITRNELDEITSALESNSNCQPLIEKSRIYMEIVNLSYESLENALEQKLEYHFKSIAEIDLDKFIEDKTKSLKKKLSEPEVISVFQRLKDC